LPESAETNEKPPKLSNIDKINLAIVKSLKELVQVNAQLGADVQALQRQMALLSQQLQLVNNSLAFLNFFFKSS